MGSCHWGGNLVPPYRRHHRRHRRRRRRHHRRRHHHLKKGWYEKEEHCVRKEENWEQIKQPIIMWRSGWHDMALNAKRIAFPRRMKKIGERPEILVAPPSQPKAYIANNHFLSPSRNCIYGIG